MKQHKRKIVSAVMTLCVITGACATFRTKTGAIDYGVLVSDAKFGVDEACSQNWIPAADCTLVDDGLAIADAAIAKDPTKAKPAVNKTLKDLDAKLPADSHAHPYIAWLIAFTS